MYPTLPTLTCASGGVRKVGRGFGVLKIEGRQTKDCPEAAESHLSEGEGLLILGVLTGSWVIAIGFGWIVWRLTPF